MGSRFEPTHPHLFRRNPQNLILQVPFSRSQFDTLCAVASPVRSTHPPNPRAHPPPSEVVARRGHPPARPVSTLPHALSNHPFDLAQARRRRSDRARRRQRGPRGPGRCSTDQGEVRGERRGASATPRRPQARRPKWPVTVSFVIRVNAVVSLKRPNPPIQNNQEANKHNLGKPAQL